MRPMLVILCTWMQIYFAWSILIDQSSIITRTYSEVLFEEAFQISKFDELVSIPKFIDSYVIFPRPQVAYIISAMYVKTGYPEEAFSWLKLGASLDPFNLTSYLNIGLVYHYRSDYSSAIRWYKNGLEQSKLIPWKLQLNNIYDVAELWFSLGVSYQYTGNIEFAGMSFYEAIMTTNASYIHSIDPNAILYPHFRAFLNYAALHHSHGVISDGIKYYSELIMCMDKYTAQITQLMNNCNNCSNSNSKWRTDEVPWSMYSMTKANLGAAYIQTYQLLQVSE